MVENLLNNLWENSVVSRLFFLGAVKKMIIYLFFLWLHLDNRKICLPLVVDQNVVIEVVDLVDLASIIFLTNQKPFLFWNDTYSWLIIYAISFYVVWE